MAPNTAGGGGGRRRTADNDAEDGVFVSEMPTTSLLNRRHQQQQQQQQKGGRPRGNAAASGDEGGAFSNPSDGEAGDDNDGGGEEPRRPLMNRRAMEAAKKREADLEARQLREEKEAKRAAKKRAKAEAALAEAGGGAIFVGDDVEGEERRRKEAKRLERQKARSERRAAAALLRGEGGGDGGENGGLFGGGDGGDDDGGGSSDSSLGSFESFDPNDLDRLKRKLNRAAAASAGGGTDPRVIYQPQIDRMPMWVHRWSDLRLFTNIGQRDQANVLDTATGAVIRELQSDLRKVETLIREISMGREGGFGEESSRFYEEPETMAVLERQRAQQAHRDRFLQMAAAGMGPGAGEMSVMNPASASYAFKHIPKKPAPDRWKVPGAALEHMVALRGLLLARLAEAQLSVPIGPHPIEGGEGAQFNSLPRANAASIEKTMFRATMEGLFAGDRLRHRATNDSDGMYGGGNHGKRTTISSFSSPSFLDQRNLRIENGLSKVPIIHKEFLVDDDGPRMHADVLNYPDMLTPPTGREGGGGGAGGRVRRSITVNINYLRLHNHERFTREHEAASAFLDAYERYRLLASNAAPGVRSRRFYEHMLRSIENEDPPHPYLATVQELHAKTCEMEASCLRGMLRAWQHVCAARAANGVAAAAAAATTAEPSAAANGGGQNNGGAPSSGADGGQTAPPAPIAHTRLEFALARVGETEATTFNEKTDNILDFAPVVTEADVVGGPLQAGQSFSIALHGQLSAAQPSQLVGITDKQNLNTLFTAVFKETFEMLTTHDPVRFTACLLDAKGAVLATVDIPASLTHAQHLLEFKTQIQHTAPDGGPPRAVTGVISLSTNWTTVAGMTIEDIERRFLKGEADPMDPRNDAMVRILGKYYIEQAIAARKSAAEGPTTKNNNSRGVGGGSVAGGGGNGSLLLLSGKHSVNQSVGLSERTTNRLRATWDAMLPADRTVAEESMLNNETYKLTNMTPKMRLTVRQQMISKRWRISKGLQLAADSADAKLVSTVIPAGDIHAERLMRDMIAKERLLERERAMTAAASAIATKEGGAAVVAGSKSAAAGAANGNAAEANISEWQQRIRNMKMTQAKKRKLRDHELQAQILILPRIPTPEKLIKNFLRWFVPRSPLNPEREDRLDIDVIRAQREQKVENSRIIVHIMKATNLPYRDGTAPDINSNNNGNGSANSVGLDPQVLLQQVIPSGGAGAAISSAMVEPFIVANFIGSEAQTRTESGPNPAFFESLELAFQPADFEDSTLSLIDDDVCISFYDRVQVTLPPASRSRSAPSANVTHYRLERRLLGIVKIPFYSLYESETASLEGEFDIVVPRAISGYTQHNANGNGTSPAATPSVHLFVSLYPAISKAKEEPESPNETFSRLLTQPLTRELYALYKEAISWRSTSRRLVAAALKSNPLGKGREIEPFVNNSKGDLTLICRYLSEGGVRPPPSVTDAGTAIRFVSLLPFVVDIIAWNDEDDVWSTLTEFLAMGAGDYEELAMLLCMYLRYLRPNEQTFLLLGVGRVFKQATFVLHTNEAEGKVLIIDPRTGDAFSIDSPRTGMEEVAMVVSHDQAWANVQLSGAPHRMVWNFSDRRYWLPMFGPDAQPLMRTVPTVQRATLEYPIIQPKMDLELEETVRREVKKALKAWRNGRQPTLQQRVGTILREVLVDFEKERCAHANSAQANVTARHQQAIAEFSAQYEAVGAPVNVGYKDADYKELLMQLYETRVHEIGTDSAIFGLGVYVKAYTGSVFSIWVYLLGLVPRDPHSRI